MKILTIVLLFFGFQISAFAQCPESDRLDAAFNRLAKSGIQIKRDEHLRISQETLKRFSLGIISIVGGVITYQVGAEKFSLSKISALNSSILESKGKHLESIDEMNKSIRAMRWSKKLVSLGYLLGATGAAYLAYQSTRKQPESSFKNVENFVNLPPHGRCQFVKDNELDVDFQNQLQGLLRFYEELAESKQKWAEKPFPAR